MRPNRTNLEIIAGVVSSAGNILEGDGFTIKKGGTGLYTIIFDPGIRVISFVPTALGGSVYILTANAPVAFGGSIVVAAYQTNTAVAVDIAWTFIAAVTPS